jgi:anthrone oxygenase-like protein
VTAGDVAGMASVLFAGLLAGEELVIRYGVRGPLASLNDQPHILLRQALIRPLRVLVPSIYGATLIAAATATALDGIGSGLALRCTGLAALLVWIAVTLGGTVPINAAVLDWNANAPPADWRAQIGRWEQLDTVRTWAAVLAFASLLTGLTVTATGH